MIPNLETERLTLRAHRLGDFDSCLAMWSDPVTTRFIGGKPSTEQQTWIRMMGYLGHWQLKGFGYWAVEERSSGQYVGELGFADFKRGMGQPYDALPELGWALSPSKHGRGYATEALRAALAWGDRAWAGEATFCLIHPDNAPSLRVAAKIGYQERERTTYREEPSIVLRRGR